MKKFFVIFTTILTSIFISVAHATILRGNEGPHGGDDVGLDFRITAQSALDDIKRNRPEIKNLFSVDDAQKTLDKSNIITVDTPLKVNLNGKTQDSVATNDISSNTILINRARWNTVTDPRVRVGIALHEVLGLMELEQTGFYPISSRYIAKFGITAAALNPTADQDNTYMNCLDMNSALYLLKVTPDNHLTTEVRGLSPTILKMIQELAQKEKVPNPEEVVGFSATIATQYYMGSSDPTPNCFFQQFNRFLLDCDGDINSLYYPNLPQQMRFEYADGKSIEVPTQLSYLHHMQAHPPSDSRLLISFGLSHSQLNLVFVSNTCH